jgi:hypothetical protein
MSQQGAILAVMALCPSILQNKIMSNNSKTEINVGNVCLKVNEPKRLSVQFSNTHGTETKKLSFESSCGCTVPEGDVQIGPRGTAEAFFTITKRKAGDFSQTVTIFQESGTGKFQAGTIKFSGSVV